MKNFHKPGKMIPVTLAVAVESGEALPIGDLFGIASKKGAIGEVVEFSLQGVYSLAKPTAGGSGHAQGTKLYYDAANKQVTESDGGGANKFAGYSFAGAADADTKELVLLPLGGY